MNLKKASIAATGLSLFLLVSAPTVSAQASTIDPGYPECQGQWAFDNFTVKPDRIGRVGVPVSNYFATAGTMTLSAGQTGTVGASVSATIEAEASAAIFAKVKASINGTVSVSQAVSFTNSVNLAVPAGRYGNAVYGRYRVVVTGDSYRLAPGFCTVQNLRRVTYYVSGADRPQGWCTWVSTSSLGSRPAQCDDGSPYVP